MDGTQDEKIVRMATPVPTTSETESERGRTKGANAPLERGLKERHVQFISLGGTIGTGLFLGIGSALHDSGPLSLFLGYIFTSCAIWAMVSVAQRSFNIDSLTCPRCNRSEK